MERFARNKCTINDQEQALLASKKVLVIGSGGLGSHVCEGLSRIGITHIGICDFDTIETSNLNRQLLALESTIDIEKAILAKKRMQEINSDIQVKTYISKYPSQEILDDMSSYDIVIDCLDSIETRKILEQDCVSRNLPLIYGTIAGSYGYFGVITKDNLLVKLQQKRGESIEKVLGNPYYTVAIMAALQLKLCIDVLLNRDVFTKGFYTIDLIDFSIDKIELN